MDDQGRIHSFAQCMVLLLFWRRAPAIATRPLHRSRTRLADSPSQAFKIHRALIRSVVEAH
ncbi:MAG TPA: hypothetical protein VGM32_03270, partial [Rhodopila sp.]